MTAKRHVPRPLAPLLAVLAALAAGCAGLPTPTPSVPETALVHYEDTPIYRLTAPLLSADGRSGFRLLPVASYAFQTRVELAREAERTLDVQYFILKGDNTGRTLLKALRQAAARGVRVRLLVDDLYSVGEDRVLSDLAALPNFEVRLFNPFVNARGGRLSRLLGAAFELARVDRRMHNKLFIADNGAAVMGGRNIADEYFMRAHDSNFVDVDLFVAGPAVRDLSQAFDSFWNSSMVWPLQRITGPLPNAADAGRDFDLQVADAVGPPLDELPPEFAPLGTLPGELASGHVDHLILAKAEVVVDSPDKERSQSDLSFPTVTRAVLARLAQARKQVIIVSPYFTPGDIGMKMMHDAAQRGGHTIIITNSLASTDSPLAQANYMTQRKEMLADGVTLRELSPSLSRERNRLGPFGSSSGSLHAKVVLIDRETVFIGSMNLDFRSAYRNTEVGIFIESPEIAETLDGLADAGSFYELRLNKDGDIEWVSHTREGDVVYDQDPETSWWQRLSPQLLAPFVPEDEL